VGARKAKDASARIRTTSLFIKLTSHFDTCEDACNWKRARKCACDPVQRSGADSRPGGPFRANSDGAITQGKPGLNGAKLSRIGSDLLPRRGYRIQPRVSTLGSILIKRFALKGARGYYLVDACSWIVRLAPFSGRFILGFQPKSAKTIVGRFDGRMAFVPEGRSKSSQSHGYLSSKLSPCRFRSVQSSRWDRVILPHDSRHFRAWLLSCSPSWTKYIRPPRLCLSQRLCLWGEVGLLFVRRKLRFCTAA
jgi:hypothetical protein